MPYAHNIAFLVDSVKLSIALQIASAAQVRLIFESLCLNIDFPLFFFDYWLSLIINDHLRQIDRDRASAGKADKN